MLDEELAKLGFGDKKIALYRALLESGGGSAADLARTAGVKRTTAYDILDELYRDRLATVTFAGKKRIFTAEPPENLQSLVEQQMAAVDRVLPGLKELYSKHENRARVRFYEGVDGLRSVHDELLKVESGEYFYFGSMSSFEGSMGKAYMQDFIAQRIRKKIWSNAIRIRGHELADPITHGGDENYRRVRYISKPLQEDVASLTLFDGKVAICSSSRENFGMVIESGEMFTILRFLWDYIWDLAEE
jgi:HTH-type transcriptional regulator, sugar sensing transcriptional regulator